MAVSQNDLTNYLKKQGKKTTDKTDYTVLPTPVKPVALPTYKATQPTVKNNLIGRNRATALDFNRTTTPKVTKPVASPIKALNVPKQTTNAVNANDPVAKVLMAKDPTSLATWKSANGTAFNSLNSNLKTYINDTIASNQSKIAAKSPSAARFMAYGSSAISGGTLGLSDNKFTPQKVEHEGKYTTQSLTDQLTANTQKAHPIASTLGNLTGSLVGGGITDVAAHAGLAGLKAVTKTAGKEVATKALPIVLQKAGKEAAFGATSNALYGAALDATQGKDGKTITKDALLNAGIGGILGGALGGVAGKVASKKMVTLPTVKENVTVPNKVLPIQLSKPETQANILPTIANKGQGEVLDTKANNYINNVETPIVEDKSNSLAVNVSKDNTLTSGVIKPDGTIEQPVSKFRTNTLERSQPKEALKYLDPKEFDYIPETKVEWQDQAVQNIKQNRAKVVSDIKNATSINGGVQAHEAAIISHDLLGEAEKTGNYTDYKNFLQTVAEKTRETARALKATDTAWDKTTADGAVLQAQRVVNKIESDLKDTNPELIKKVNTEAKQVKDTIQAAEQESAEQTSKEFAQKLYDKESTSEGELIGRYTDDSAKRLANKVDNTINPQVKKVAPLQSAFNDLTKELSNIAKEVLPKNKIANKTTTATDILNSAIANKGNYKEVWNKAKSILLEKYKDNKEATTLLENYFNKGVIPDFSVNTVDKAISEASKILSIDIKDLILNNPSNKIKALSDIKAYIVGKTGASDEMADALTMQIGKQFTDLINGKNWNMLENLIRTTVKKAPTSEFAKVKQLRNMGAYYSDRYATATGKATENAIRKSVKDFDLELGNIIKQSKGDKQKLVRDIQNYVLYNTGTTNKQDAKILAGNILEKYNELLKAKTASTLKQMFKETTTKSQKSTLDKVMELINLGAYDDEAIRDIIKAKNKLPVLGDSDIRFIVEKMNQANKEVADSYNQRMLRAKVLNLIANKIPSTGIEKMQAMQRIMMLFNLKTTIVRNPFGNAMLGTLETIKNVPATGIDKILSLKTGNRTTTIAPTTKGKAELGGMWQGLKEWGLDIKNHTNTAPTGGQADMPNKTRIFTEDHNITNPTMKKMYDTTGKIGNRVHQVVGRMLQLGDRPFYQGAYNSRIAELKILNKSDAVTDEMKMDANMHALERTFQNDSALSSLFVEIKSPNVLNKFPITKSVYQVMANLVLPFAKTPSNILDKFIDYSGVGISKAAVYGMVTKGKGTFNQKYFVDTMARGLTGAGLATLGYLLARKGLVTGGYDTNKKVEGFETALGKGNYAFKIGDTYQTFDWALPAAAPIALGAAFYEAQTGSKEGQNATLKGLESAVNLVFNSTVLQGPSNLMGGYSPAASIGKSLLGSSTQATPTLGKQISQLIDPYTRETYDPNTMKQVLNKTIARLPFASKTLPIKQDVFGNDIKAFQGKNNVFNVMLNPGFSTTYKPDKTQKEIERLYTKTGSADLLPSVAVKNVTIDGKKINLTTDQYTKYAKTQGQTGYNIIKDAVNTSTYQKSSDKEKADIIKSAYEYASEYAKKQTIPNYEMDGWKAEAYQAVQKGLQADDYIMAYNTVKDIKGDKNAKGNSIPLSASRKKKAAIDAIPNLTSAQKKMLYDMLEVSGKLY